MNTSIPTYCKSIAKWLLFSLSLLALGRTYAIPRNNHHNTINTEQVESTLSIQYSISYQSAQHLAQKKFSPEIFTFLYQTSEAVYELSAMSKMRAEALITISVHTNFGKTLHTIPCTLIEPEDLF